MLDLFVSRYAEVRARFEEKIYNGEVYPCLYVVYPESSNAWKYNFKVCKRHSEEEKKLAYAHNNKCLEVEEEKMLGMGIKLDSGV